MGLVRNDTLGNNYFEKESRSTFSSMCGLWGVECNIPLLPCRRVDEDASRLHLSGSVGEMKNDREPWRMSSNRSDCSQTCLRKFLNNKET